MIEEDILIDEHEVVVNSSIEDIAAASKESLNFLSGLCIPDVFIYNFPDIFESIFALLSDAFNKDRDFSKFALALPRGHGKSTFLKILMVYIILFTKRKFILLNCATEQLAINIMSDVADILDSPNIIAVFGNWRTGMETDTKTLKVTFFRGKTVIIAGIGSGGTLRGFNLKNARPDCILCDDLQTKEESKSPSVSKGLIDWFQSTLIKAKSPEGCTYLYIGNMYPDVEIPGGRKNLYTCLLRNFQQSQIWTSIIVGGILSDGKALWEELQPKYLLLEELEGDIDSGVAEVFFSEVMNDPQCGINSTFDITKMKEWDLDESIQFIVGKFLMIDPSLGKKKSDDQIVGEFEVWDDGIVRLMKIHKKQVSAPKLVEWCLAYANVNRIPAILSEIGAYQETLLQWFDKEARDKQIEGIQFLPMSPDGRKKNTRIINSFKSVIEGRLQIHPNCLAQWLSQVLVFDPMKQNNLDDILDDTAYGEDVVLKYSNEIVIPDFLAADFYGEGTEVLEAQSPI